MPPPGYGDCSDMPEMQSGTRSEVLGVVAYPRLREAEKDFNDGCFDTAAARVIQHLREHRDEPRGLALLGAIALKTGAFVQAEQFLRRAMSLGLQTIDVQRALASALHHQDRLDEALNAFTYLEQITSDPQATATRALILDKLGRNSDARPVHEEALKREPNQPQFWLAYGHNLRAAGRTDEAIAAYRRIIEIDSEHGEAWWSLASIKSRVLTDKDVEAMNRALEVAVDILNVVPLHFALGRAWHDRKQFERAFGHFREANCLRASVIKYNPDELTEEVDEFIRTTGTETLVRPNQVDATGPVPVFLVSMARSGSTLLEQILDQHPKIEATGELPYVKSLMRAALELHTRREPVTVPQLIQRLSSAEKNAFGADYMSRAELHRHTDSPFFIDKMPMNWSDILFIREILPQARFIEIRRNAMDCCFSNFVHHFSLAHAPSFDLVHQARCYVDYTRLIDHIGSVAPEFICNVRYERLIEEPEAVLRQTLGYLGLDWDDALLQFHESDRVVRTPSAEQVRRPLNRQGVDTWKPYEQWLGPLRDALGPLADA